MRQTLAKIADMANEIKNLNGQIRMFQEEMLDEVASFDGVKELVEAGLIKLPVPREMMTRRGIDI